MFYFWDSGSSLLLFWNYFLGRLPISSLYLVLEFLPCSFTCNIFLCQTALLMGWAVFLSCWFLGLRHPVFAGSWVEPKSWCWDEDLWESSHLLIFPGPEVLCWSSSLTSVAPIPGDQAWPLPAGDGAPGPCNYLASTPSIYLLDRDGFHLLASVNSATVDMDMQISLWDLLSSSLHICRSWTVWSYGGSSFCFLLVYLFDCVRSELQHVGSIVVSWT